jgi:cytochrome c biogenesis protein CcdA
MWSTLIIGFLVIAIVIDIICYKFDYPTLSAKVRDWTAKYPLLPFLTGFIVGLLSGHWWWPAGGLPFGL